MQNGLFSTIAATLSTADEFSMKQIPAWLSLRNDNSADLVTFLHTRRCRKQLTHVFTYYSQLHYEVGSMSFPILPIGKLIFREICYLAENQQLVGCTALIGIQISRLQRLRCKQPFASGLKKKKKKTVIKNLFLKPKQNSECFWHQHTVNTLVYILHLCHYIHGS